MKSRLLLLGALGLALGLTALGWAALDLPGRALVRGHLADVGIVMAIVAVCGLALPRLGLGAWGPRGWIALTAVLALFVETLQAMGVRGEGLVGELTIGATFDPLDLIAYALGLVASAVLLRAPLGAARS